MRRVFISYSRSDLDAVKQLVEDMKSVDIDAWYDQTLPGGQRWWDDILAHIRESDVFILALSHESWDSEACRSEFDYVLKLGKSIVPVVVSEDFNMKLLTPPLNEIQVTDCHKLDKHAALALIRAVDAAPAASPLPDPLPPPPSVPVSYVVNLAERIGSNKPLSAEEQKELLFQLENGAYEGRFPTEIRELLTMLKDRTDVLASIAARIDETLKRLQVNPPTPPTEPIRCPQCHEEIGEAAKFCQGCGKELQWKQGKVAIKDKPVRHASVSTGRNTHSRRYNCNGNDTPEVVEDVDQWLILEGFETQRLDTEDQGTLLQIKKRGGWRNWVGMATSLNIVFRQLDNDTLDVEIGAGKWIDKAAAGTVSLLILWPLAITAGLGAWEQMKMPDRILDYIGQRLPCK